MNYQKQISVSGEYDVVVCGGGFAGLGERRVDGDRLYTCVGAVSCDRRGGGRHRG